MAIGRYLTEIDRLEREREHLLCGHYRLKCEGARSRLKRRSGADQYIAAILDAMLVPFALLQLPDSGFGPFTPGLYFALVVLGVLVGIATIAFDVNVLLKQEYRASGGYTIDTVHARGCMR